MKAGPSLEGERGELWLPQVFGTYLIGFQKSFLLVDPYLVKKIFRSPKFKMLTRPLPSITSLTLSD